MSKLIRLYPRDPKRGWYIQTYLDPGLGVKILGTRGWYQVEDDIAAKLKDVKQKAYDPRSGPAFMIANSKEEAREMDAKLVEPEEEEAKVGTAEDPVKLKPRPGKTTPKPRTRKTKAG
jgi:hypothetical protein